MLRIPFGKHKDTGQFFDAGSVANGLRCGCICIECGNPLEAVHPKLTKIQNYFRHASKMKCEGGLESLFHLVGKQILKENNVIHISDDEVFKYHKCEIETPRHGKRPDAFITNDTESLIVEIFYSHMIDETTLDTYLKNGERVLQIDISDERKKLFDYNYLKELILKSAYRQIYSNKKSYKAKSDSNDDVPWWLYLLLLIGGLFLFRKIRKKRKRRR